MKYNVAIARDKARLEITRREMNHLDDKNGLARRAKPLEFYHLYNL